LKLARLVELTGPWMVLMDSATLAVDGPPSATVFFFLAADGPAEVPSPGLEEELPVPSSLAFLGGLPGFLALDPLEDFPTGTKF